MCDSVRGSRATQCFVGPTLPCVRVQIGIQTKYGNLMGLLQYFRDQLGCPVKAEDFRDLEFSREQMGACGNTLTRSPNGISSVRERSPPGNLFGETVSNHTTKALVHIVTVGIAITHTTHIIIIIIEQCHDRISGPRKLYSSLDD